MRRVYNPSKLGGSCFFELGLLRAEAGHSTETNENKMMASRSSSYAPRDFLCLSKTYHVQHCLYVHTDPIVALAQIGPSLLNYLDRSNS